MSNESRVTSNEDEQSRKILVPRPSSLVTRFLLAFQFLTMVTVKVEGEIPEREIGRASAFFPIVGAFQGLMLVQVWFL